MWPSSVRATGRTTRAILKSLLAASETPNQRVVLVVSTPGLAKYVFQKLSDFATVIGRLDISRDERRVGLPNGSEVRVVAERDVERWQLFADARPPLFVEDPS